MNQILSENLLNKKFQSNPLVQYEERHGGPLWFDLSIFTLEFRNEHQVKITIDKSLSKKMTPRKDQVNVMTCNYKTIVVRPDYITGQIESKDGQRIHFETLLGKMEYIYLEQPTFWKESLVLKRKRKNMFSTIKTTFLFIIFLFLLPSTATSQSYFSSKEEVINYFEGSWNLDIVYYMGHFDTLPCPNFMNSSINTFEFSLTNDDSLPLLCKSFVDGLLHEEKLIEVEYNDNDGFPGPWRLKNLPEYLNPYVAILEDAVYFYELSADSITLFQMAFDGLEYGLSRSSPSNIDEQKQGLDINIYPNPVINNEICYQLKGGQNVTDLRLYDYAGKNHGSWFQGKQEGCIGFENLIPGLYIIELATDKGKVYREKIVK